MSFSPHGTAPIALAFLVLTAGCVGVLTGSEPLVVAAEPVAVAAGAQDDAGYEEVRRTTQELEREVSAAGQTRRVVVTNHVAEYSRSVTVEPFGTAELARFVVVSTPAVEVFGQTFNPVGDMSNRELVELVQDEYEGLNNVQSADERTATALGEPTTVSTFTGDAEFGTTGRTVELTIHVTRLRHEGDFIVAIAVHPSQLPGEAERVDAMLRGVRHSAG